MIVETIKREIKKSGLTRYRISLDTGIDQATLCRIMQGKAMNMETADILCKYFGLELTHVKRKK